jgi:hypothetical protein
LTELTNAKRPESRLFADYYPELVQNLRKGLFASCWHESRFESAALWDQYGRAAGLAITSTIGRLKASDRTPSESIIGRVQYLDFSNPSLDGWSTHIFTPPLLKRKSFEHEREVRLLKLVTPLDDSKRVDFNLSPSRLSLSVHLGVLIESVYISPESPDWMMRPVEELLRRFGLGNIAVRHSGLYDPRVL